MNVINCNNCSNKFMLDEARVDPAHPFVRCPSCLQVYKIVLQKEKPMSTSGINNPQNMINSPADKNALICPGCKAKLSYQDGKPFPASIVTCPRCKTEIRIRPDSYTSEPTEVKPTGGFKSIGILVVEKTQLTRAQEITLSEGKNILGRQSTSVDVNCPIDTDDMSMGRAHAMILVKKNRKGGYDHELSDNQSKNGVRLNGKKLESDDILLLKLNDEIVLGQTKIILKEKNADFSTQVL
jgi:predicted Zn finger-like uncharacterized protein